MSKLLDSDVVYISSRFKLSTFAAFYCLEDRVTGSKQYFQTSIMNLAMHAWRADGNLSALFE